MYSVTVARTENGDITDISVSREGRTLAMHGPAGPQREMAFADGAVATLDKLLADQAADTSLTEGTARKENPGKAASNALPPLMPTGAGQPPFLPVLLGSGSGVALSRVLEFCETNTLPLLVIDAETPILEHTCLREQYCHCPGIEWITDPEAGTVARKLTLWQTEQGGAPLIPLPHPFYQRLSKDFYTGLKEICEASRRFNFWQRVNYPRFASDTARILMLTNKYFLTGEITSACERLDIPCRVLQLPDDEYGHDDFVKDLLESVVSFKPDFAFTINHLGVDREGVLVHLLEKLRLPLASWFVDNPHLVLSMYRELVTPWTSIFTWDTDNIPSLEALGYEHVRYLPLGTDAHRFTPPTLDSPPVPPQWKARISFVGNSMVHKVAERKNRYNPPAELLDRLEELGAGFAVSEERDIEQFFRSTHPELTLFLRERMDAETRLGYEAMLTWEATRQYRLSCVSAIFPFEPLIVGDSGWHTIIPQSVRWRYHSELSYYTDLPRFYPGSDINFNCTSKQMKGAVNQRVFDVPATGNFLLTDYREQVENLFEPGREIICYHSPEEATALAERFLAAPEERLRVSQAARRRVLAEHTYDHRLRALIAMMRQSHG